MYTVDESTLVVGDGDFSFSLGLCAHRGGGEDLLITSYDSAEELRSKYPHVGEVLHALRKYKGVRKQHGVDATRLQASLPGDARYDRIVFLFPHSGQQRVHVNRALLRDFLYNAKSFLEYGGQIHLTLKTRPPYNNWQVEKQAELAGLTLAGERPFDPKLFPGYQHQTTDPQAKHFDVKSSRTYIFVDLQPDQTTRYG